MKYQDTLKQAEALLPKAISLLKQFNLAASPINYMVAYEYVAGNNKDLITLLDEEVGRGRSIDDFFINELYKVCIVQVDQSSDNLLKTVDSLIDFTHKHTKKAHHNNSHFMNLLDEGLLLLDEDNVDLSRQVIDKLLVATSYAKKTQSVLLKALKQAENKVENLHQQIDEINNSHRIDALTGLFNRSVMNEQVDIWLQNNTQEIAALAINLDNFSKFNESFGPTIGNVILSKVAQKVKSYVNESGVAVRMAGEEFLVLIPDANIITAQQVAEKVRHGVEKLQFVNAKNKQKLPKITVSIGVSRYTEKVGMEGAIKKASSALQMAKVTGRNRVFTDQS